MAERAVLPDISDLRSRIRFSPSDGRIWLDNSRMILLHASAFGSFRNELIHALGVSRARRLLTRMGYVAGSRDAELARKVRAGASHFDAFLTGPQLHALEGIVRVDPLEVRMNLEKGEYYGDLLWTGSVEGEAHLEQFGPQPYPVCWMQIGYACGYTTAFLGRPVLYREVECCAAGFERCRIIGRPLDEWDNPGEDLQYIDFGGIKLSRKIRHRAAAHRTVAPLPRSDTVERIEFRDQLSEDTEAIVGASAGFIASLHKLRKVALTAATVLLVGESGVGKECFAQLLHYLSPRRTGPFIAMNCAAVPPDLFEAELFGVRRGAYTGAVDSRPGRFERASGGTLFLDEVSTLPSSCQAKLLRALEEGRVERLGDTERRRIDVRIVAATNIELRSEVEEKRFRADLFYRLNVFPIVIPPLRRRRDDIPILLDHFIRRYCAQYGKRVTGLTEAAIDLLLAYDYPGNVRELQRMVERAVILSDDDGPIDRHHLIDGHLGLRDLAMKIARSGALDAGTASDGGAERGPDSAFGPAHLDSVADLMVRNGVDINLLEANVLRAAVRSAGGNLAHAARQIGITRAQLAYRLEKHARGSNGGRDAERLES